MTGPARGVLLTVAIIFFILNSGWIISALVLGLMLYVPYFAIWFLATGGKPAFPPTLHPVHQPSPQYMRGCLTRSTSSETVVKAPKPLKPKPLSFRQWQAAHRRKLAVRPASVKLFETSSSFLASASVLAVLGVIGGLVAMGTKTFDQPGLVSVSLWCGTMALLGSWTVLFLGKRWESREEDKAIFRFKQLTAGLVLGAIAYSLSNYLMVPWDAVSGPDSFIYRAAQEADISIDFEDKFNNNARHWNGFYAQSRRPVASSFCVVLCLVDGRFALVAAGGFGPKNAFQLRFGVARRLGRGLNSNHHPVSTALGHDHRGVYGGVHPTRYALDRFA